MRMRALVGFLAATATATATAIAGCGADGADRDAVGGGGPSRMGEETTVSVGETVDFSMYTHCGVESTNFNGRVWNAVQPLYSSPEKLGPPPIGTTLTRTAASRWSRAAALSLPL